MSFRLPYYSISYVSELNSKLNKFLVFGKLSEQTENVEYIEFIPDYIPVNIVKQNYMKKCKIEM
jgi:hypothetical protein